MKRAWAVVVAVAVSGCVDPIQMMGSDAGGGGAGDAGGMITRDGGTASAPQWTSVDARVAGRTGRDVRVEIKGLDRNLDVVSVATRLMDSNGATVSEGALLIEGKKWTGEAVSGAVWARGMASNVTQVAVTLIDATGLQSDERVVSVTEQPVIQRGSTCDATFLENRCEAGLGCRGMPTVCDEGLAPQVTRLAFYRGATGPTILLEGTEPEDDLETIRFEFQNAQGQPISIDSDGDGTPDLRSFDQSAFMLAVDGTYFLSLQSGADLDMQVPKLVATPIDAAGHAGMAKITAPTTIPMRSSGQSCDPRGFDVCATGLSCSPGIVGATTNKCASAAPMRTQQCNAAPVLIPSAGGSVVVGIAEGGSLWDAPLGCSTADPKGRPEGIVLLRLAERADRVKLSTVGTGTNFDTTIYVAPGCASDASDMLGCNDDIPQGAGGSELVLENLPAGDYVVIVDSFDARGGGFELRATIE